MHQVTVAAVCLLVCLSALSAMGAPSPRRKRSDDVPALQTLVSSHSEQLTLQDARLTALQNSLTQVQQLLQQHNDQSNQQVAFHARLSSDANLDRDQTFKFDHVSTNLGSAYDPQSGIFTAPISGVYSFFFSTHGTVLYSGNAYLMVNGQHEVLVNDKNELATGHGIFHLNQGERVWVASNGNNVHSSRYNTYFTGFLLNRGDW